VENAKRKNNKAKRAHFRALARQDQIRTGRQFARQLEQPCFDFEAETERANRLAAFQRIRRNLKQ